MPKTIDEILGTIQDPEAKSSLQATINDFNAKVQRLTQMETELQSKELVDKNIANGWRKFDTEAKPKIETELKTLREEVARLRPEADAASVLRKQIDAGSGVVDPKDLIPAVEKGLEGKFISAGDRKAMIEEAVKTATERVNFGSLPMAIEIVESTARARREYGLDIPASTFSEAVTRFGGVNQAYSALTADAAKTRSEKDRSDMEAKHKSEVEAAKAEGMRLGRQEADTRAYNPEESGASGIIPMVPPQDKPELQGVNPQTYNPSDGQLAREAAAKLSKQEADGLWGSRVM